MRKSKYKDLIRYTETRRKQKERYRYKNGCKAYEPRAWTQFEDRLVLEQRVTDSALSKQIKRSVGAIQLRRYRLKNKIGVKDGV